jgi:hypothetical protein
VESDSAFNSLEPAKEEDEISPSQMRIPPTHFAGMGQHNQFLIWQSYTTGYQ